MLLTIARITFLEAVRQPIYFIITALTGVAMFFTTWGTGFSMGYTEVGEVSGDNKLLLDLGLATIFLAGTLLAAFLATSAMSREIENKTVLTVVSKPVPRAAVVTGKYIGVTVAVLVATLTMVAYLMLAIRHGVLSNASQDVDGPVVWLGLGGAVFAIGLGVWGNFFYGWSFAQTATLTLFPVMVLAAIIATSVGPQWNFSSIPKMGDSSPTVPMLAIQFKPGVLVAALSLTTAIAVLCAIAVAASTRLGQVMTLVLCFSVLVLGMLTGPLVGRFAYENAPVATVLNTSAFRERMVDFEAVGDRYIVNLRSAPGKVVKVGDPVWYGAFPSGFDMASGQFTPPPVEPRINPEEPPLGMAPAILVLASDPKLGQLTIGQVSGTNTPVRIQRPPREGDHLFLTPTKVHPFAMVVASVLPNFQHFWLLDAVAQNQAIPLGHFVLIIGYGICLVTVFLAAAIMLFQGRDVG